MNIETTIDDLMLNYAKKLGFGDMHFKLDKATGLFAIITIHSTKLGPALGGCRCIEYTTVSDAILDALRLAQGMSYKAAVVGLPLGGGKSVLLKPKTISNRVAYFEKFGEFIEELNGRYITAMDSGTNPEDMDAIAHKTRYVSGTNAGYGDPSPFTAHGVFSAIQAAVKFKLNRSSLDGIKVAIQGLGHVGLRLAKLLTDAGAKLIVTDINTTTIAKCVNEFGAKAVELDEIYSVDCDVFAPCALGAIINDKTIPKFNTTIIVGAANNQLAEPRHGDELHKLGILYGPDYVVNAGGLVCAYADYSKIPLEQVHKHLDSIYDTTLSIFQRSAAENIPTHTIADIIAEERINSVPSTSDKVA